MHLARVGHDARSWARDPALVADMRARRANAVYLPDIRFPASLRVTADLAEALAGSRARRRGRAVARHARHPAARRAARPSRRRRSSARRRDSSRTRCSACRRSSSRSSGPASHVAVLSGPSFAAELARELPTAVSVASRDAAVVERVQAEFRAPYFRLYGTERRRRRGDRRRAEERHRHRRRRRRRAGPRAQRAGRPHHARAGRDLAAGVRRRRASARRWRA